MLGAVKNKVKSKNFLATSIFLIPVLIILVLNYFLRGGTSYHKYNRKFPLTNPEVQCLKIVDSEKYICEKRTENTLTYEECECKESFSESLSPEVTE